MTATAAPAAGPGIEELRALVERRAEMLGAKTGFVSDPSHVTPDEDLGTTHR